MKQPLSTPPQTARSLAVEQLNRIEIGGAYVGLLDGSGEDVEERTGRQATEYVGGITRWRRWLDYLIGHYYRGDYDRMEPMLKQILRVGLYDLLVLSTPPHAAINEAVSLAKRLVRPGAGGLVNGLLRTVQRQRDQLPEPEPDDLAEAMATRYSHPTWMVRRWLVRYGTEATEALLRWNNTRPRFGVRVNPLATTKDDVTQRLDALDVAWEPSPYLDDFVRLRTLQPVVRAGLLEDGTMAVQDESSGLVVRLLDPQPGETVLDTCSAPGGKAIYAAERMQNRGRVLAYDVHPGRLRLVADAARAHRVEILEPRVADLRHVPESSDVSEVDRVLVDAPCSGLGVLAKRADLRWNRVPEEIDALTDLQDQLLDAAAKLVRPGGVLVYSTCTIEPEENEIRVAAFLKRHRNYRIDEAGAWVPEALCTPNGFFSTLPHLHGVDGAFAVRFRRLSEDA